jgi:purine-binding chemotaxis protein CheW
MKVQEIIGIMPITKVPRVPEYVRGVINLRGRIIPTIELRTKFGIKRVEDTDKTCIIVVEVMSPRGKVNVGIIVDQVAEVIDVDANEIDQAPEFGTNLHTDFILGVGVVKGGVKILLDIDKVLTTEEMHTMQTLAQQQS